MIIAIRMVHDHCHCDDDDCDYEGGDDDDDGDMDHGICVVAKHVDDRRLCVELRIAIIAKMSAFIMDTMVVVVVVVMVRVRKNTRTTNTL